MLMLLIQLNINLNLSSLLQSIMFSGVKSVEFNSGCILAVRNAFISIDSYSYDGTTIELLLLGILSETVGS